MDTFLSNGICAPDRVSHFSGYFPAGGPLGSLQLGLMTGDQELELLLKLVEEPHRIVMRNPSCGLLAGSLESKQLGDRCLWFHVRFCGLLAKAPMLLTHCEVKAQAYKLR